MATSEKKEKDLVLFSVPPIIIRGPHLAPALLKAYCEQKGYSVKCINPSIQLFESLPDAEQRNWPYNDFEKHFSKNPLELDKWLNQWIDQILQYNPRIVGLSTHAWSSQYFVNVFAKKFREKKPETTLIMGGPPVMEIGHSLKSRGLIDHFVGGDGEEALLSILDGSMNHPNIDCTKPIGISNKLFNELPYPDFSDSDFHLYKQRDPKNNRIYLIGSRGCVFNCSFCNVPSMTDKYRFKAGKSFAEEVHTIQARFSPAYIELADSILNGSMSVYREFINEMVELNKKTKNIPQLDAFFRCRPRQVMKPKDFAMSARAGIKRFRIGVESGSYDIRRHIGKKETNEDIFYTLEQCLENNIGVNLLLIAGYVTETEKDFQQTIDLVREIRRRDLDRTIDTVVVNELYISEYTPLREKIEELGIQNIGDGISEKSERLWWRKMEDGTVNDSNLRTERVKTLKQLTLDEFRFLGKVLIFSSIEDSWTMPRKESS